MPAHRPAILALSVSALALSVAACKVDSRPLLARDASPAYGAATPASYAAYPYSDDYGLPYAQPAQLAPIDDPYDGYALAERAYAYDRASYRAPPDYGFRYGDVDPWAWQLADNSLMFAEPYGDDYRFYYYEPGASYPYFVRDPYYGYGYGQNGALMAVFDAAGALLSGDQINPLASIAGRYLARGYDLRNTYYDVPHYTVADRVWIDRAPVIYAYQEPWIEAAQTVPVWRQYRASTGERFLSAFEPERVRRERIAERYERRIDWDAAKEIRKARHEELKATRKFVRDEAKADRKVFREEVKQDRKFERERVREPRNAFDSGRPASARVDDHPRGRGHDDNGRRADGFRGEDRPFAADDRRHAREIARNDAPRPHAEQRHDDHGGDRGKHDDNRGGGDKADHGGGKGHGGGDKGGDHGKGHGKH